MIRHRNFEANIVHGCNNRCASCNHLSPFAPLYFMEPEVLRRDLAWLKPILHLDLFCLQGGEPLLHPRLLELMDIAGEAHMADTIGILSNGKLLTQMEDAFWQKCAQYNYEVRVTVYPNLPQETIDCANRKASQFGVYFWSSVPKTKFFKMLRASDGSLFQSCPWKQCWTVHEGFFYVCPISTFLDPQILSIAPEQDGLRLHDGITEDELLSYVNRTQPLRACCMCAGSQSDEIDWHQSDTLANWIKDSTV